MNWLDYWLKRKDLAARAKQCWPLWITLSFNSSHTKQTQQFSTQRLRNKKWLGIPFLPASPLGSKPASGKRSDILFVCRVFVAQHKMWCAHFRAAQLTIGRSVPIGQILPDPNKNAAKLSNAVNTNLRDAGSQDDSWPIQWLMSSGAPGVPRCGYVLGTKVVSCAPCHGKNSWCQYEPMMQRVGNDPRITQWECKNTSSISDTAIQRFIQYPHFSNINSTSCFRSLIPFPTFCNNQSH